MIRQELGQSLNLGVELIPEGRKNRSGGSINPQFITIHNTSNTNSGADASAHSRFVRNTGHYILSDGRKRWVSWHYTVDDGEIIKHLPINERAYHAGSGNSKSIAIEICMNSGIDQAKANERAVRLVTALLHDLKLPLTNIVPHRHWTGKNCPILILPQWNSFVDQCGSFLASIETDPSESDEPNTVLLQAEEAASIKAAVQREQSGIEEQPDDEDNNDMDHTAIVEAMESTR